MMYTEIRPGFEEEAEEIKQELRRLMPTVASATNCYDHGWISPSTYLYWWAKLVGLYSRYRAVHNEDECASKNIRAICERSTLAELDRKRSSISSASR